MSLFSSEVPSLGEGATVNGSKIQNILFLTVPLSASSVNSTVFVAPVSYKIVSVQEVHGVVGGAGATVNLEVVPSGTANGAGVAVLTTPVALTTTVNTPTTVAGTNFVSSSKQLVPAGSRIGVVLAGTLTGLANGVLQIGLQRV